MGRILIGVTSKGLCAVCLGDSDSEVEAALARDYPEAEIVRDDGTLSGRVSPFLNYFAGQEPRFNLPLDIQATAFQRKVWKSIQNIPYGGSLSYGEIARKIGFPDGARAVARACATNPVPLVIPCHRVVRQDGDLGGYRWGIRRKQALLTHERAA